MPHIARLLALLMIFTLLACSSGPAPKNDSTIEMAPTMSPLEALAGAGQWLPEGTEGVAIISGPEGWRELETWLFPLADAALEPGSPGTAAGFSEDLTILVQERLGFDIFSLHTLVVGANTEGATVVAFGDAVLDPDLPTMETPMGPVFALSMDRFLHGGDDGDEMGFGGFNPQIYILPVESPRPGLVFSLSPESFGKSAFLESPGADRLRTMIAEVEGDNPAIVLAAMSAGFSEMGFTDAPIPESFLLSLGNLVTLEIQGSPEILDEVETSVAAFLEEGRRELRQEYESRAQRPLATYFAVTYGYHLIEGLAAQATPQRSENKLRYIVELSNQGWLSAAAISGMASSMAMSNYTRRARAQDYAYYPDYPDIEAVEPPYEDPLAAHPYEFRDSDLIPIGDSYNYGNPDAPVKVVAFMSMECPFSARAANTLRELAQNNPWKVQVVFKHFPLDFQLRSEPASRAAEAAAEQGKFWEMQEILFDNQDRYTDGNFEGDAEFEDLAVELAAQLNLDIDRFRSDFHSAAIAARVQKDRQLGQELGFQGTPHTFINGEAVGGAQPLLRFQEIVDRRHAETRRLEQDGIPAGEVYSEAVRANLPVE